MKKLVSKTKNKIAEKMIKKEIEKMESGMMGGGGGGEDDGEGTTGGEETDGDTGEGRFSKLKNKIKGLGRKPSDVRAAVSKKSKSETDIEPGETDKETDGETDGEGGMEAAEETDTPIETTDGSRSGVDTGSEDGYNTPASQNNSSYESDSGTEAEERKRLKVKDLALDEELAKPEMEIFLPNNRKTKFTVAVRVVDAMELQGFENQELNPLVSVVIGKKCRKTRLVRGTDNPVWDQTMCFKFNTTLEELGSKGVEFNVYSAGSFLRNSLIGAFRYDLSLVYKAPGHKSVGKWLALRSVSEEGDTDGQIRGFLRVCIGITFPGSNGSTSLPFREDQCEVVSAADSVTYRLQVRVFKILSLMHRVRYGNVKTPKAALMFAVEVCIGEKTKCITKFCEGDEENIAINEEVLLPLMWPTVTRRIRIRILSKKHKKARKKVVATAWLNMKSLCQSGDNGYLPLFGPSFINFFGPDLDTKDLANSEIKKMRDGESECTVFYGRLLCDLDCESARIHRPTVRDMPTAAVNASEAFYTHRHYTLFCTFFSANVINPEFKMNNVQYAISIGEFGNPEYDYALKSTDRTLQSMPIYDSTRYYAMPWGTHKPVCEIQCSWEEIGPRIAQSSAILRVSRLLKDFREEAELRAGSNSDPGALVSVIVNAIDEAIVALRWIEDACGYKTLIKGSADPMWLTKLDSHLEQARFAKFRQLEARLDGFKYTAIEYEQMDEGALNKITDAARDLDDLIVDAQISIPDVLILMLVDHRPVAYAKIPIAEIAFNTNAIKSGVDCGQLKTIYLKWMKHKRHHGKLMEHSLPSVLQARFWFGLSEHRHYFEDAIAPGKLRYYAELFVNEKKGRISGKFAATKDDPYPISDELGTTELSEAAVRPPAGWRFDGDWRQQRTHDMYVGPETGSRRFEDECFERQKQSDEDWIHDGFTTYYGDPIAEKALDDPPPGWVWDGKWEVDLHCEGGVDGWIYSIDSEFSEKAGACDVCERKGHKYRRRRLKRFRLLAKQATMWSMFEDVDLFRKRCDNSGWEYAKSFEKPLHMQQQHDDRVRRKRLLREIVRERANAYKLGVRVNGESISPRIYEVHEQISAFQLRVYCLWGRELVCPSKVITRTFVRVFFLHRCQETAVIKFTTNPIFNETLLFDEILVNGGILSLTKNPPSAVIEVLGETFEGSEVLLGRFELAPVVLSTAQREPPKIRWFALQHTFDAGNGKGALLAYAELYQSDPTKKRLLPKLPILKGTNRFEVPPDFRPNFVKYTVQILCWGMRNLQRFKMSKIRQPWLEISVADLTGQTLPLKDSQTTPNFEDPLITFRDVMMPDKLYYAPPIQIALFDQRTFGMMPQVGVCTISNFSKYLRPPPPVVRDNPEDWIDFNSVVAAEQAIERRQLQNFDSRHQRDSDEFFAFPDDPNSPRIDWWCKYFHSNGEDDKAPGYAELGLNKVLILRQTLENTSDYRGFGDFLDTFYLERHNRKKHRDTNRSKDICGELKGKLFIVKHGAKSVAPLLDQVPGAEFEGVVPCVVRVYVVRALDLVSCNKSGYLDPYVSIHLGSRKMKSPYIADTCNPIFGHMFEITADIPRETTLRISIGDSKRFFGGEQLGETTIDLENRLLTKHRATVGLPLAYNLYGPLPWRDQLPPLDVLGRFCRKMGYPVPKVLKTENDCGLEVLGQAIWLSTLEPKPPLIGHFLGRPIQRVALAALHAIGLVPEHVETRPLASSVNPDVEVGRIECFVDIFPKVLGSIPPPIDISPRKPDNYQLRIVIWRVRNVIFKKRSFLAPSGDLYVRCFFQGTKGERTDIHYRVLDGNGSFNWRFVFNFEFDPWERMMSLKKKTRWFRKASTALVEPVLVVQICDNNKFSRDTVIGEMQLPLLGFEEAQAEDDMVNVRYERRRKLPRCIKQCHWCWKTKCCLLPYDENLLKMPKAPFYVPRKAEVRSLFQQRYARGWWPCTSTNVAESQRCVDKVAKKKKDDDYEELQEGEVQRYVTGIIEMEVGLLTAEDAAKEPVGRKRKKPNRNPFLPKPDRSKWDSNWCLSRCRTCTAFWWKTVGPQTVCWSIAIIILITIIVVVIYRFPDIVIMASTASVNLFTKIVTRSNSND